MAISPDLTTRESNLRHLFLTNEPPSESEEIEIRSILTLTKDDSDAFEKEDRRNRRDLVAKCEAALSCIRRVPPELIAKIFAMCVPEHIDDDEPWSTLDLICVPWVLVRVSSLWRVVALRQSGLWAYIKIDLEKMAQDGRLEPPLAMLEASLERSGNTPLRIFFHDTYQPTHRAQEMLFTLMAHSHRWSELSIFISYLHLHLTNQVRGRLPLLRYLNIGAYGANTFPPLDGFEIAPMLRDVLVVDEWEALILPWTQLTSLGGETTISPTSAIRKSPELLRCHFNYPRGPFGEEFAPVTRHEKLIHITMNVAVVLRDMILPYLEELVITKSLAFIGDPQLFADFFQHSGGSLRVFTWKEAAITDPAVFRTVLQNIPNLVQLELGLPPALHWALQANVLVSLTVTQSWRVLPKLETVRIQFNPKGANSQSVIVPFLDMVESRWVENDWGSVTRLQEARITKHSSWKSDLPLTKGRIDALLEQGLLFGFDE